MVCVCGRRWRGPAGFGWRRIVLQTKTPALISSGWKSAPLSIIVIGILFILLGTITLVHALVELINTTDRLTDLNSHWMIYLSAIAAIVGGAFLLKGHNWACWLLVLWMAFHVVVAALHGLVPLLTHAVIFSVILFFLFRPLLLDEVSTVTR